MPWLLRKCKECGEYTLRKDRCPHCGGEIHIPHPAKFSPDDKYLRYRVALKRG
ncbi:MAG: RNA-protein complex protein Nop10 [Candidatus Korarchaeota archaeon]|nr:RNA-protein complex protein Nop10 [Candidatus Korarchaeota archaeon]NIU85531.1 RNA-protein complex protein Nop10 [Candidatus Thorarchaeota archaeon]NIW15642.1 RNA-protein complex protein Nop10 [Candidatus Thorarchaeota archaeon]